MTARTPEDCDHLLAEYLASGSVDGILTLYEPDAVFITEDRQRLQGHAALREVMGAFAAVRPRLTPHLARVERRGDALAIIYNDWSLTVVVDGNTVEQTGRAVEVLRRQADGTWRFAYDDPYARSV